jgi:hypothetical protein
LSTCLLSVIQTVYKTLISRHYPEGRIGLGRNPDRDVGINPVLPVSSMKLYTRLISKLKHYYQIISLTEAIISGRYLE